MDTFNIIIAGSRSFTNYHIVNVQTAAFLKALKELRAKHDGLKVISGTAMGADQLGERFAAQYKLALLRMPAQWDRDGRGAGYRRNERMLEMASACIVFWDGQSRGSQHMYEIAVKSGIPTALYDARDQTVRYHNMPETEKEEEERLSMELDQAIEQRAIEGREQMHERYYNPRGD